MRTNIDIDDRLMADAIKATGARTKKEAVTRALQKVVQLKRQEGLRRLRGIGWEGDLEQMRRDA